MPLTLTILTPDRKILADQSCHQVELPGLGGIFGVLAGHTPLVTPLAIGEIRTLSGESAVERRFAVANGFVEVTPEKVTVTAQAAEAADQIDVARAEAAIRRAEKRLRQQHQEDIDAARAQAALARALNRLKLAEAVKQA